MNKTHVIDGKTYVEVDRKADAGDYVYISRINNDKVSEIRKIETTYHDYNQIEFREKVNGEDTLDYDHDGDEFVTLEPIVYEKPSHKLNDLLSQITPENKHEEWPPLTSDTIELTANDIRWQPERVIDLLANLARRVSSLEAQMVDAQGNVERQGVEIANVKYLTESNEGDIRELDDRTQVVNAIQKYYGGARQ